MTTSKAAFALLVLVGSPGTTAFTLPSWQSDIRTLRPIAATVEPDEPESLDLSIGRRQVLAANLKGGLALMSAVTMLSSPAFGKVRI